MTIAEVYKNSTIPIIETEVLLSDVLKKDRSFINSFPETVLTEAEEAKILNFLNQRKNGKPIPYILGFKEFYGLKFLVDQNVLIPRPETETLVEKILTFCSKQENQAPTIADVGTGSGAVAIALTANNPNLKIIATDISPKALGVAAKNAQLHQVGNRINFIQSNLLENVKEKIDIIAANLPYIPTERWEKLPTEIKDFEPRLALDSGKNAKILYRQLFQQATEKLNPNGIIFYEIDGLITQVSVADLAEILRG